MFKNRKGESRSAVELCSKVATEVLLVGLSKRLPVASTWIGFLIGATVEVGAKLVS